MSEEEQILMSVGKPEALAHAEIHAMRQLADAVTAQSKFFGEVMQANTRALERVVERVDDMNSRLIRLEEQKHGREIENVRSEMSGAFRRINDLESTRDQQKGAKALVDWLRVTAPWLIAIALGVMAALGWKQPTP